MADVRVCYMLTETENYFHTKPNLSDEKMAEALHEVGRLVARELRTGPRTAVKGIAEREGSNHEGSREKNQG